MRVIIFILCLFIFSLPVSAQQNMKVWAPYLQNIEKKIKASWYEETALQRHTKECATNVVFTILKDGSLEEVRVIMSNCDEQMQQRAVSVVKKNAPFPPFPKEVASTPGVNVNFIFNYVLLPENKQAANNTEAQTILNSGDKYIDNNTAQNAPNDTVSDVNVKNKSAQQDVNSVSSPVKYDIKDFMLNCIIPIILLQSIVSLVFAARYKRKLKNLDDNNSPDANEFLRQKYCKKYRKVFLIITAVFTFILITAILLFVKVYLF